MVIAAAVLVVHFVVLPVICALKGKWWYALFTPFVGLFGLVGAIRPAKPHSYWARHWYDEQKMAEAVAWFAS
jgi:hypothetical protein